MSLSFSNWIWLIEECAGKSLDNAFPGITGFRVIQTTETRSFGTMREVRLIIYTVDKRHEIGSVVPISDRTPDEWVARSLIRRALEDYPDKTIV